MNPEPRTLNPAPAPGSPDTTPAADAAPQPKPRVGKEIVIAWEASLMYLLKDGKPTGKPLVLNAARHQYLRAQHLGSFRVSEKMRLKRSNLYDVNGDPLPDKKMAPANGAYMRNWMRLGNLAVGLHYSPAFRFHRSPGLRHRSHGCYRMSRRDSNSVFQWASVGTPVHIVRSLGGTEWESLRAVTPPEMLPGGVKSPEVAERPKRRRKNARVLGAREGRQAAAPQARPSPKPKPRPAAPPAAVEEPAPPALDSAADDTPAQPPAPPQSVYEKRIGWVCTTHGAQTLSYRLDGWSVAAH